MSKFNIEAVWEHDAQEYADQYCASHGGNFTHEELRLAYLDGVHNRQRPQGFQQWKAWQQGMIQAGNQF